jgi:hypothetical protein
MCMHVCVLLLSVSVSPQGGMVLVSHDFRLIDQVANEIWVCEKQVGFDRPRLVVCVAVWVPDCFGAAVWRPLGSRL